MDFRPGDSHCLLAFFMCARQGEELAERQGCRCSIQRADSRVFDEPPDAEAHVRWCVRTAGQPDLLPDVR